MQSGKRRGLGLEERCHGVGACIRNLSRTGSRVDQATTEQLRKRIQLLEKWKEHGYDGKR